MKDVTRWASWEEAKARIEAPKAKKEPKADRRRQSTDNKEETTADTLTDCGGIKLSPLLPRTDEEE